MNRLAITAAMLTLAVSVPARSADIHITRAHIDLVYDRQRDDCNLPVSDATDEMAATLKEASVAIEPQALDDVPWYQLQILSFPIRDSCIITYSLKLMVPGMVKPPEGKGTTRGATEYCDQVATYSINTFIIKRQFRPQVRAMMNACLKY